MKILIGYDGSDCADAAIEDLSRAGLPDDIEALIVTASDTWLPKDFATDSIIKTIDFTSAKTFKQMRAAVSEKTAESEILAADASRRVQQNFPVWRVHHQTAGSLAEWGIVAEANKYKPDLIVVGSHGRGSVGRFVLGSVSLKVLSEAKCSVRVARALSNRAAGDDSPLRIVVAVDGSADSANAVETVLRRDWLPETSVRLVSAVEPMPFSILLGELPQAEKLREGAAARLKEKGLHVSTVVEFGRAKNVIVEEAEKWGADAIFIGAKGHTMAERVLLGSVSYAVAARAHCSVEVVRGSTDEKLT